MQLKNLKNINLHETIITILILAVVIFLLYITTGIYSHILDPYGDARTVANVEELPEGSIHLLSNTGEEIKIDVLIAENYEARNRGFKGASEEDIEDTVLLLLYPFRSSIKHRADEVQVPLDIGFFNNEGKLLKIFQSQPGNTQSFGPEDRYSIVIQAQKGFFEEHGLEEGSIGFLPDSIER